MVKHFKSAVILFALLTVLTGGIYPLLVTGLAQFLFPYEANGKGSVINRNGILISSSLIGQFFSSPNYFWGRPSATAPFPYNAAASSGSNLGPTNSALVDAVKARIATLKAVDPDNKAAIPIDLVTASASGLDPHISPAAARYQINRVAKARHLAPALVQALVDTNTESRQGWFLGEPRVNVLQLNLSLGIYSVKLMEKL